LTEFGRRPFNTFPSNEPILPQSTRAGQRSILWRAGATVPAITDKLSAARVHRVFTRPGIHKCVTISKATGDLRNDPLSGKIGRAFQSRHWKWQVLPQKSCTFVHGQAALRGGMANAERT